MNHMFNIEIAEKYGLEEAILLENINFWCTKNKANKNNFKDGEYWTFNSVSAFSELFPYISNHKISRALKNLEEQGLINVGNYNENQYDRTKWYSITGKGKSILQNKKMEQTENKNAIPKNANGLSENDKSYSSTDNKPSNKPSINTDTCQNETNFVFEQFKEICVSLPVPRSLTETRKSVVKARLKDYKVADIVEVFRLTEQSDFLTGRSSEWQASFDWILKPANFIKILEGNYKNKTKKEPFVQSIHDYKEDLTEEEVKEYDK